MSSSPQTTATFDPLAGDYLADPYPTLTEVRVESPAFYASSIDMWVVTRFADVEAVFMDPATFSARIAQDPLSPLTEETKAILADGFNPLRTMSNAEPDTHVRTRAHAQKGFSNRRIALMEGVIREPAAEMIEAMAGARHRLTWWPPSATRCRPPRSSASSASPRRTRRC